MPRPAAILLNGTSSSGKTTLARALQLATPEPLLYASNDQFIFMTPDHILKNDALRPTVLLPLLSAFHRTLPLILGTRLPVIIDHVIERWGWMDEIAEALHGFDVFFVKVHCPLEELERRELARGDRQLGFARMQLEFVHRYGSYDAEIDTHAHSFDENVASLQALLHSDIKPTALPAYRQLRQSA